MSLEDYTKIQEALGDPKNHPIIKINIASEMPNHFREDIVTAYKLYREKYPVVAFITRYIPPFRYMFITKTAREILY